MSETPRADHPLVLASASASRARLLRQAGLAFTVQPASIDEEEIKLSMRGEGAAAADVADMLAELKARRVSAPADPRFVIGADQMLVCEGEWFDKPVDKAAARAQLLKLRGRRHELISAVVICRNNGAIWRHRESAELFMRDFSEGFLDAYLAQAGNGILGSVGAYELEGLGVQLFRRIQGDFFTILGLPMIALLDFLREHRIVRP